MSRDSSNESEPQPRAPADSTDASSAVSSPPNTRGRPGSTLDEVETTTKTRVLSGPRLPPSPDGADDEYVVLSVLAGPHSGKQYRLGAETTLGRGEEVSIPLPHGDVSRLHARVVRLEDGGDLLEDLGSRNGTRVNGDRIQSHVLQVGDRVGIGAEMVLLYTRRSRAEEDLLEKQKLESLGRLAGGVAHDFNNLLAVVQGNVQLVKGIVAEPDPDRGLVEECLDDVLEASQRAGELVTQLLGFARRGRWEEAPTDLSQMLEEVSQLARRSFDRRVRIESEIEPGLVTIGDRAQLYQALMNLCLNARDAMPDGGRIELCARAIPADSMSALRGRGPQILVEITDHGVGMDTEIRKQVFEPFFTTKPTGAGAGLGLALVYGVVASHGGQIWVDSEVGQGTTFHVALPAADPQALRQEAEETTLTPQPEGEPAAEAGTVLLVDDEPLVRRSVGRMLAQLGYQVETAMDGVEALEKHQRLGDRLALVLLDLVMPAMSGDAALREIRARNPGARVLVMSGHHDEATVEKLRADGAAGFLLKPFGMDQLTAALKVIRERERSP